jgi:hypothetical protein
MSIERIDGLPEGAIGFRAKGEISGEDYKAVLEPPMRDAVEAGEVRLVFVVEESFKMEPGALREDAKTGIELGFRHPSAWKRMALVTDVEWVARAIRMFAWMTPGEVKIFELAQLDEAKAWVAG